MSDLTPEQVKWLKDLGGRMDMLEAQVTAQSRYIDNLRVDMDRLHRVVNNTVIVTDATARLGESERFVRTLDQMKMGTTEDKNQ